MSRRYTHKKIYMPGRSEGWRSGWDSMPHVLDRRRHPTEDISVKCCFLPQQSVKASWGEEVCPHQLWSTLLCQAGPSTCILWWLLLHWLWRTALSRDSLTLESVRAYKWACISYPSHLDPRPQPRDLLSSSFNSRALDAPLSHCRTRYIHLGWGSASVLSGIAREHGWFSSYSLCLTCFHR